MLQPTHRYEWPLEGGTEESLAMWLEQQPETPKFYWRSRDGQEEWACAGSLQSFKAANRVEAENQLEAVHRHLLTAPENLRAVGGMRFDPNGEVAEEWSQFPAFHFWIPRFEKIRRGERLFAAVNDLQEIDPKSPPQLFMEEIADKKFLPVKNSPEVPALSGLPRLDEPGRAEWIRRVEQILGSIRKGSPEKAVLARKSTVILPGDFSPYELLAGRLEKSPQGLEAYYEGQAVFLADLGETIFWGATPERLLAWRKNHLESEAVAGTRPRERNSLHDFANENELLRSTKDLREQTLVLDFLKDCFESHAGEVELGERGLRNSGSVQHLFTRITGELRKDESLAAFILALHPTPATGIAPKEKKSGVYTLADLRTLERFDRGWYAGAVGWMGKECGDLSVAIRSCLSTRKNSPKTWTFYTGAGITAESDPLGEWEELEAKLSASLGKNPSPTSLV